MRIKTRPLIAAALLCLIVVVPLGCDLSRPPARQLTARAAVSAIGWYKRTVSGHLGAKCRFTPTCSDYAVAVIQKHGAVGGGWLTVRRLVRCGPWTPMGTVDPPD
jgi:putative membrane protein insertion efficiency factor